jgi:hypothetical protein
MSAFGSKANMEISGRHVGLTSAEERAKIIAFLEANSGS